MARQAWVFVVGCLLVACGDTTVVEPTGGGGNGGATGGSGGTGASGGGPSGCLDHDACEPDEVCLFGTGQCVPACDGFCGACGPGFVCDGCATSSCPACADCLAACVPIAQGQCDEDNPCDQGEVCLWGSAQCVPACDANGGCADPNLTCMGCVTGSCCGCDDCVSACM